MDAQVTISPRLAVFEINAFAIASSIYSSTKPSSGIMFNIGVPFVEALVSMQTVRASQQKDRGCLVRSSSSSQGDLFRHPS
jgi:hypothetical protein